MWYLFAIVSLFGHASVCIWMINRLHATALPHRFLKALDLSWYNWLCGLPVAVLAWLVFRPSIYVLQWEQIGSFCLIYGTICSIAAVGSAVVWYRYLKDLTTTQLLLHNHTDHVSIVEELGHRPTGSLVATAFSLLPANQVFQLAVHEKTIELPRLPKELDGLSITHLSDLHFTGQVTREYFEEVVRRANQLESDFTVITGDIVDKPKCMPWLTEVLGKLESRRGIFFVLGNHDLRVHDEMGVRGRLTDNGHYDLGGRSKMTEVNGKWIFWAGNELPWFARSTNMAECSQELEEKRPFRIALSHSPDQIDWARSNDFDLMLAGHTHGGQIRFPAIGPIFAPSWHGVKYASGTFYEDPTLLHVSRGLSGTRLLRFNCPPELTKLVLRHSNTEE